MVESNTRTPTATGNMYGELCCMKVQESPMCFQVDRMQTALPDMEYLGRLSAITPTLPVDPESSRIWALLRP